MVATKSASLEQVGRRVSMSRTGRYVVVAEASSAGAKLEIVDAIGTAPRVLLMNAVPRDFVTVGDTVWTLEDSELVVSAFDGNEVTRATVEDTDGRLWPTLRPDGATAILHDPAAGDAHLLSLDGEEIHTHRIRADLASSDFIVSLHGNRVLSVSGRTYQIEVLERGVEHRAVLPGKGTAIAAAEILGGKAICIVSSTKDGSSFDVVRPHGSLIHRIEVPRLRGVAFAEIRGLGFGFGGGKLMAVDLRYGRILHEADPPLAPDTIDIDSEARHVVMAGYHQDASRLSVYHVPFSDVFQRVGFVHHDGEVEEDAGEVDDEAATIEVQPTIESPPPPSAATAAPIEIPDLPLRALRDEAPMPFVEAPANVEPYTDPAMHLGDLLDLVVARTACAIANAWDSGELSQPLTEGLPFEKEVRALIGHRANAAPQLYSEAASAVERIAQTVAARTRATLAIGGRLPLYEISRQFNLSPIAAQILPIVAAPSLRREAARLYGVLSNDTARPVCDRALVETILAGGRPDVRASVSAQLDNDAPLLINGLLRLSTVGTSERLFASLSVDSMLLRRLLGELVSSEGPGAVTSLRKADRTFDELVVPAAVKRDIVIALLEPGKTPPRIVIRGRPGFGRTTLMAAIAAKVELPLAVIDAERLPSGETFPDRLRAELQRATLRGALPCVRGLENRPREEQDQSEHVREVFRSYPGPIGFRTTAEYHPPLDPGFFSFTLPTLLESQRHEVWEESLERHSLHAKAVARLAARYLVGPGTIESIVRTVAERIKRTDPSDDLTDDLDRAARQHLEARLGDVANRVTRLARWEQVALPDDMIDSIREFIGRVVHRRTVYEKWGFADKMATSRGLTALFYGQPGTGKTMVAGLIARELGLDLYRVDLANVTSKWIGETEKNLGRVFDAAEDGQAVILFDEADSLFAKRTEVKSSVDRYANLEVNYLLQRFDSFEGVAILTTNMEGAIDSAFKRRLSLRLEFPFPDEEMRVRLWAAHIPSQAPTRGDFDFVSLASRFPMSGGYIRNSALRAAFLAAQEGELLSQEHLERAIALEYREMGKLSPGGRMA